MPQASCKPVKVFFGKVLRPSAPAAGLTTVHASFKDSAEGAKSLIPAQFPQEQAEIYMYLMSQEPQFELLSSGLKKMHSDELIAHDVKVQQ